MKKQETLRALDQMTITHKVHMDMMRKLEGEKIRFCKGDHIVVGTGIEYLADAAGTDLDIKECKTGRCSYKHSFKYRGVEFIQVNEQKLSTKVYWDED